MVCAFEEGQEMPEDVLSWEGIAFFTGKHQIEEFGKAITTFLMILNNPLFPWPGGTTLLAWPNARTVWRTAKGRFGANQASIEFAHHFPFDSIGREDFALPKRYSPENPTIFEASHRFKCATTSTNHFGHGKNWPKNEH